VNEKISGKSWTDLTLKYCASSLDDFLQEQECTKTLIFKMVDGDLLRIWLALSKVLT
jgi:hypothetical protein